MTDVDLVVSGGRVYVHGGLRKVTLGVTDGRVSHLASSNSGLSGGRRVEADGNLVLPGCVDAHVHVRPGDDREGVDSGTAAAAAGGVTTVVDMPNFPPTITDRERWADVESQYEGDAHVDYSFFGHVTEDRNVGTGDVAELATAGAPAFKTFLSAGGGPDPYVVRDKGDLLTAFEEVAETGRPFWIHAEDDEYHVEYIERVENRGLTGMDAFLESAPPILETTAVRDLVDLAERTGTTTVIAHTTTADALDIVADARADGVPIYAETTPYYLGIDERRLREIGTTALGTPPVRSPENREALWDRFDDGRVDTVATDHAPRFDEEKDREPIDVGPGMPQLETALAFLLTGVNDGRTTVDRVVETYARRPAQLLGFHRKGHLEIGADADFVIVDKDAEWTVDPADFESRAKYSPFDGWTFSARPVRTFVRGQEVARDMNATDATPGQLLDPDAD